MNFYFELRAFYYRKFCTAAAHQSCFLQHLLCTLHNYELSVLSVYKLWIYHVWITILSGVGSPLTAQ